MLFGLSSLAWRSKKKHIFVIVSSRSFDWYPFCYYYLTLNVKPYFSQSCQKSPKKCLRLNIIILVPIERSWRYDHEYMLFILQSIHNYFVENTLFDILDQIVFLFLYKMSKNRCQLYKYTTKWSYLLLMLNQNLMLNSYQFSDLNNLFWFNI